MKLLMISDALAQGGTAGAQGQTGFFGPQLIMLIAIFVLFYFLLIRPQAKRAKEHKQMVESLNKGDEVVSNGGMLGRIADIDENFITLEVADGVKVKIQRQAITTLVPKGTFKGKAEEK